MMADDAMVVLPRLIAEKLPDTGARSDGASLGRGCSNCLYGLSQDSLIHPEMPRQF